MRDYSRQIRKPKVTKVKPTTPTETPVDNTCLLKDIGFYTSIAGLAIGLTSVAFYGYKRWTRTTTKEEPMMFDLESNVAELTIPSDSEMVNEMKREIEEETIETEIMENI